MLFKKTILKRFKLRLKKDYFKKIQAKAFQKGSILTRKAEA